MAFLRRPFWLPLRFLACVRDRPAAQGHQRLPPMARTTAAQAKAESRATQTVVAGRQAARAAAAPALVGRIEILGTLAAAKRRKEETEEISSIASKALRGNFK